MKTRKFLIALVIASSFIYAPVYAGSVSAEEDTQPVATQKPLKQTPATYGFQGFVESSKTWVKQALNTDIQNSEPTNKRMHYITRELNYSHDDLSRPAIQHTNISRQTIGNGIKSSAVKAKANTPLQKNTRKVTINARLSENSQTILREKIEWTLYRTDKNYKILQQIRHKKNVQLVVDLEPGHYTITGKLDYASGQKQFEVGAGKKTLETITMPFERAGQLKLTASLKKNGARIKQALRWNVYKTKNGRQIGKPVHKETTRKMNYTAPEGTYIVVASLGEASKKQKITIRKGRVANDVITLDAGTVHLMAINSEDNSPVISNINWSLSGRNAVIKPTVNRARATSIIIPAGNYTANAKSVDGQNGKESFTIAAGESKRLKVLVR